MTKKVLIIIPAYNEEKSILNTIQSVEEYSKESEYQIDYVVINDGSTDNTKKLLMDNNKNAVHLVVNLGIGGAVQTGYKYAQMNNFDIAVQFDGDGQHDINSLPNLLKPITSGKANMTIGSRFVSSSPSEFKTSKMRRIGITVLSGFIKFVAGKKVYDVTSGYRAADKGVISLFSKEYPHKYPEPETIVTVLKNGLLLSEEPANMFERQEGVSSITPLKSVRYMIEVCYAIVLLLFVKKEKN